MTHEQINRAIAEACGWGNFGRCSEDCCVMGDAPQGVRMKIPNFFTDLNAMHEAEKVLTEEQCDAYGMKITLVMSDNARSPHVKDYCDWHAAAHQRAEAFLKTIGKWVD
jgi:hypothetical protein